MSLLFKFRPLVVNPELATLIGLNEAIILQQINYWLNETDSGIVHNDERWIYNSHEEWNKQFPFWSQDTIKRTITSLKKQGVLRVEKLAKDRCNHTNYYSINHEVVASIEEGKLHSSKRAKRTSSKSAKSPPPNSADCPDLTYTTTEITTEITTESSSDADKSAPVGSEPSLPAVLPKQQQGDPKETELQMKCREAWTDYKNAYFARYGIAPVRNAKVNAQVKQLVQRLGAEAGPVAEFYVLNVNDSFVVRKTHDLGTLLSSAESYRTQWATGQTMTNTRAQQIDSTQTNANATHEAIAMLRAREGARP